MAQNPFGNPQDGGQHPFFNPSSNTSPEGNIMVADTQQGSIAQHASMHGLSAQDETGLFVPDGSSEPMDTEWEASPVAFSSNTDDELERYMSMVANDNAAIAPGPEESFGQGQQPGGSLQARPSAWGPGINGETVPNSLLPLYTNIPLYFQSYEYWRMLVDKAKTNSYLTPRFWVSQMVRALKQPTTLPDTLFGWTLVSPAWRTFFLTDCHLFTANNMTPELWISMINHIHITTPHIWQRELPPPTDLPEPVERGDPSNYVSHYMPTIQTAAPLLIINPEACGSILKDADFKKKKCAGPLSGHPQLWGSFFDDGPKKENENEQLATLRIKWARSNMGIIRRPSEKIPQIERGAECFKDDTVLKERDKLRGILSHATRAQEQKHFEKMDRTHPSFDPTYRRQWLKQQKDRRAENNRRRNAAYEHAARYYRHMGLPVPERPEPAEESDDEYFFDPVDPIIQRPPPVDDSRPNEPYRCKPCVDERGRCTYRTGRFPCRRCIELGREAECVSSRPGLIQKAAEQLPQKDKKDDTSEDKKLPVIFTKGKAPFIPSFALPPERLTHHAVPVRILPPSPTGEETLSGPGTRGFRLLGETEGTWSVEGAHKAAKRTILGVETADGEEPNKKRPKSDGRPAQRPGGRCAREREVVNRPVGRGRMPRLKKKDRDRERERFEPCDNCKAIGHIDWCEEARPCQNCVLNGRADTCDASQQNQPYTTNPRGVEDNGDDNTLDDPFDNSGHVFQQFNSPGWNAPPQPPQPPLDPDEAAPYSYLQDDVVRLYEGRSRLGELPIQMPHTPEGIVRAFIHQDRVLRRADANYRPLTLIWNVEVYSMELIAAFVDDPSQVPQMVPGAPDPTFTEALWQGGHLSMPSPEAPVTVADVLRSQAQQPHSPSQSILNFGVGLALRPLHRHEERSQPTEPSNIGDDMMDWLDDGPADEYYHSLHSHPNAESFNTTFNSIFRDVEPQIDPALVEQPPPAGPAVARVSTAGIAAALQTGSQFLYPITWYLENIRAGYDVAKELASTERNATPCDEDLNSWNPGTDQVVPCPSPNGIACDAWTCLPRASCSSCWDRQKAAAPSAEMRVVANTKAWFCRSCKDALDQERMRPNSTQPMLNRCYCVSQLQDTRLCNEDRVNAREAIANKTAEESTNMAAMGWTDRCGQCWKNVEDVTTGAWRCVCCSQVVTLP